jgi:hypothetical protein
LSPGAKSRVTWSLVVETRAEAALLKTVSRVITVLREVPRDVWARRWEGTRPGSEIRFWTPAHDVDSPVRAAGVVLETAAALFSVWTVALMPVSGILCQGWTPPEAGDGRVRGLVHGSFVVEIGEAVAASDAVMSGVKQRVVAGVILNLAPVHDEM